jgi:hypothetical protein
MKYGGNVRRKVGVAMLSLALCVSLLFNFWFYRVAQDLECAYQKAHAAAFPAATSTAGVEAACGARYPS